MRQGMYVGGVVRDGSGAEHTLVDPSTGAAVGSYLARTSPTSSPRSGPRRPRTRSGRHSRQGSAGELKDMGHEAILEYTATQHVMLKHAQREAHDTFRPA